MTMCLLNGSVVFLSSVGRRACYNVANLNTVCDSTKHAHVDHDDGDD